VPRRRQANSRHQFCESRITARAHDAFYRALASAFVVSNSHRPAARGLGPLTPVLGTQRPVRGDAISCSSRNFVSILSRFSNFETKSSNSCPYSSLAAAIHHLTKNASGRRPDSELRRKISVPTETAF
jgi:hypothetical protein